MKRKKIALGLSVLACSLVVSSCGSLTSNNSTNGSDSVISNNDNVATDEPTIKLSVEKKEKPTFDGYSEIMNEDGTGKYKFYYFNVGEVNGVPISVAEAYRYSGVDIDVSYTIEETTESGIQKNIEKTTQIATTNTQSEGYVITKGEQNSKTGTYNYSYSETDTKESEGHVDGSVMVGTEVQAGQFFAKASAKAEVTVSCGGKWGESNSQTNTTSWGEEFSKSQSVEAADSYEKSTTNEESVSIANAYSTYKNSSYSKSKTITFHLNSGLDLGYYRYALFGLCDLYLVLAIDTANSTAYKQYIMYPTGNFYYGMQYSSDGKFNENITDRVNVDLSTIVNYLNYEPKNDDSNTSFMVTFNTDGGTSVPSQKIENGNKVIEPIQPTREGFTFGGWYTDVSCTNKYNFNDFVGKDITLYAKWTAEILETTKYTVKFNSNGGSSVTDQIVEFNSKATKPNDPTRSGYTFAGWYKDINFSDPFDFDNDKIVEDTVVYAKWEAINHNVTFICNDKIVIQDVKDNEKYVEPSASEFGLTNDYIIDGWYLDNSYTQKFNPSTSIKNDLILYGNKTQISYTINVNDFSVAAGSETVYSADVDINKLISPERIRSIGYRYVSIAVNFSVASQKNIGSSVPTKNLACFGVCINKDINTDPNAGTIDLNNGNLCSVGENNCSYVKYFDVQDMSEFSMIELYFTASQSNLAISNVSFVIDLLK